VHELEQDSDYSNTHGATIKISNYINSQNKSKNSWLNSQTITINKKYESIDITFHLHPCSSTVKMIINLIHFSHPIWRWKET